MKSLLKKAEAGASAALKSKKTRRRLAVVCGVLVILGLVLFLTKGGSAKGRMPAYAEAPVESRTITSSLTGSGTLQPASAYTVTTLVQGDILSAGFEEGDTVEKDTVLYEIDSSDAANNIEKSQLSLNQAQRSYDDAVDSRQVRSAISGAVFSLSVEVGDEVSQGQEIAVIRDSGTMKLTVPFPADDAKGFSVGQAAEVLLDGSFEKLSGAVTAVSGSDQVGTGNMMTRNVTVSVKNPGGLGADQAATVTIGGAGCAAAGKFTYQADSTVTAAVSGTVTAVHVREGAAVSKDQVLVTLGGDALESSIQNARDNLRSAQLSMDSTQNQMDNYTLTSPISGTVVDKQYKAGDTVESGKNLCTIYDLTYLELTMNIDELDIGKISVGQSVQITADAVGDQTYTGEITKVSLVGQTSNGVTSYPVTVRIDETEGLRPGMNVDAEIVLSRAEDVLAVPVEAVSRGSLVLVTKDSPSAQNPAEQEAPEGYVYITVETGVSDSSYIQITSGLQSGDTVAYQPASTSGSFMMMGGGPPPDEGGGYGGGPGGDGIRGGPMG